MDLTFLKPVYDAPGPFATVYLAVGRTDESGAREAELRWRAASERLAEVGAPAAAVEALAQRATESPAQGGEATRLLVADSRGEVLLERIMPGDSTGDGNETVTWGALPDLLPLLKAMQESVPYVLVLLDRVGADIEVRNSFDDLVEEETVDGETHQIRKVNAGGWSQRRFQQNAENTWQDNADDVAKEIDRLVAGSAARLVAVAGDVRARSILADRLGTQASERLVELESGGRAEGASREAVEEELRGHVVEASAREVDAVFDELQAGLAGGLAVEGLSATCEALRRGQADRLLITADAQLSPTWIGSNPLVIATSAEEVRSLGEQEPVESSAVAALIHAAAAADAGVVVLPAGTGRLSEGVGAVLRYTDASTGS